MPLPPLIRSPVLVTLLVSGLAADAGSQAAGPNQSGVVPPELIGTWTGEARHGAETAPMGLEFYRAKDGVRIGARLWMPVLNSYGSLLGPVAADGATLALPGFNTPLRLAGDSLTGSLYLPGLTFTLRKGGRLEPEPNPDSTVPIGPEPAWTYRSSAAFWSSPVVAAGVAYLGDAAGRLHAVDVRDGQARWIVDVGAPVFGAVAVGRELVYLATDAGLLLALDRGKGTTRWRAAIGGGGVRSIPTENGGAWDFVTAAPVVADGLVYAGSADGTLHAIDARTGESKWTFAAGGKLRAAALVTGDRIYLGSTNNQVYALDRETGRKVWQFDTGSPVTTSPVLADGKLVIGTRDQALLYALDPATGKPLWTVFYWLSWVESTPAFVDGTLYVGASDSRRIRAIDPADGRVRWATQVWGWTWGTPLVVGDTVYYGTAGAPRYFVSQRASLGALDRKTGTLVWRRPLPLVDGSYISGIAGSLVLADRTILAAGLDGTLRAFPLPRAVSR